MPGKLIVDEIEDSGGTSVIGRKNYIINGNFDIWQRGTSLSGSTSAVFLADRWETIPDGATYNLSRGSFTAGQTDVPNNPKHYADYTITSPRTGNGFRFQQAIEDVNTLAGETITISFWAKYTTNAPTNFVTVLSQNFGSGGSAEVSTNLATGQTLTTSWQKFEITGTVPSISGKTVGTSSYVHIKPFYNTNNETFDVQIAQVQVEVGSVATNFEVRPIAEELVLCQRYYQETPQGVIYQLFGHYQNTTSFYGFHNYKGEMRASPTISFVYSTIGDIGVLNANANTTATSIAVLNQNNQFCTIDVTTAARTQGNGGNVRMQNNAHIEFDAEL